MMSKRPYKGASTREEAVTELRRCAGTQFDPRLVELFVGLVEHDAPRDAGLEQWNVGPDTVVRDGHAAPDA
jgi:HD-GYP domain-containing protein (c-di-GMP phosphodiesterase class II)